MESFDAKGVSFVSITQAFNTTTSMGRLTLNVLLSFAQFEREVTGERIRDKIAASRAKGMWMGGIPSLGYDISDRKLVVNAAEAKQVRDIFTRYLELGAVHALKLELDGANIVSKRWRTVAGKEQGGLPFSRGALFQLLKNPIYIGQVRHKDKTYPGQHAALLEVELFEAVQAKLRDNAVLRRDRPLRSAGAWLKGKIFDAEGRAMTPSFGYGKGGKPFRYYISSTSARASSSTISRVSGPQIEALVADRLKRRGFEEEPTAVSLRVELHAETIHLTLPAKSLPLLELTEDETVHSEPRDRVRLVIRVRAVFRGGRTWLVGPGGASPTSTAARDPRLIKALQQAHVFAREHGIAPTKSTFDLRQVSSPAESHKRKLLRLAYLAPDLQAAILNGTLPPGLTLQSLMGVAIPVSWVKQRELIWGRPNLSAKIS